MVTVAKKKFDSDRLPLKLKETINATRKGSGRTVMDRKLKQFSCKGRVIRKILKPEKTSEEKMIGTDIIIKVLKALAIVYCKYIELTRKTIHSDNFEMIVCDILKTAIMSRKSENRLVKDSSTEEFVPTDDEVMKRCKMSDSSLQEQRSDVNSEEKSSEQCAAIGQPTSKVSTEMVAAVLETMAGRNVSCTENNEKQLGSKATDLKEEQDDLGKCHAIDALHDFRFLKVKRQEVMSYQQSNAPVMNIGDVPWKQLNREVWRLHTFCRYPHSAAVSAIVLAADGFAYYGSGTSSDDKVICYFCTLVHKGWLASENIHEVHKRLSSQCPMITGQDCNNVPLIAPENGLDLFARLEGEGEKDFPAASPGGLDNIEEMHTDDCPESHQQGAHGGNINQQSTLSRPSASGPEPTPTQQAQAIPQGHLSSAGSKTQSANRGGMYTVTAHQVSDTKASSAVITSGDIGSGTIASSSGASSTPQSGEAGGSSAEAGAPPPPPPTTTTAAGTATGSQGGQTGPSSSTAPSGTSTSQSPAPASSGSPGSQTSPPSSSTTQTTAGQQGQTSTTSSSTPSEQSSGSSGQGSQRQGSGPSYQQLGIITERPKRFEYALRVTRLRTYDDWPRGHHLNKEDLADAGFYYAGYGDCARCFYCGGGLRNWELNDNVWVEHARWFPRCAFIKQSKGQAFIDAVKKLNDDNRDEISYDDVMREMGGTAAGEHLMSRQDPLEWDAAVLAVTEMGYKKEHAREAATKLKNDGTSLSADKLFECLFELQRPRSSMEVDPCQSVSSEDSVSKDHETINTLKEQNSQLRQQTVCKICMDKEVSVVFLPCGHLVSCSECASALENCPVCRQGVRGIVRAFMS